MVPMWSQSITTSFWVFLSTFFSQRDWVLKNKGDTPKVTKLRGQDKLTQYSRPSSEWNTTYKHSMGSPWLKESDWRSAWGVSLGSSPVEVSGEEAEAGRRGVRLWRRTSFSSGSPTQGELELGWSACDIALSWARTTTSLGLAWVSDGWSKK